jgi:hypothetical protein
MKRLPGVVVSAVLLIFGSLLQLLGAAAMGFGAFLIPGLPTSTGTPAHTQPACCHGWHLGSQGSAWRKRYGESLLPSAYSACGAGRVSLHLSSAACSFSSAFPAS